VKRSTIRGVRIEREPYREPERPYRVDWYDAAGNMIETLGRYADLTTGREAFAAAVRHRPRRHLCLRRDVRVVARHEPGARALPFVIHPNSHLQTTDAHTEVCSASH